MELKLTFYANAPFRFPLFTKKLLFLIFSKEENYGYRRNDSKKTYVGGNKFAHRKKNRASNLALTLKRGTRYEYR